MISLKNSFTLVLTKLKVRKIRMIITLVVSGLMFAVLFFAVMFFEGFFFESLPKFAEDTLSSKNILEGNYTKIVDTYDGSIDDEEKRVLDEKLEQEVERRVKRAKELGVELDRKQLKENLMPYSVSEDENGKKILWLNRENPITEELMKTRRKEMFENTKKASERMVKGSGAKEMNYGLVVSRNEKYKGFLMKKDGKYDFVEKNYKKMKDMKVRGDEGFELYSTVLAPKDIYEPFLVDKHGWTPKSKKIPIMLPVDALESVLGLKKLESGATSKDNFARLKEVREKSAGLTINMCLLNSVAMARNSEAVAYQKMSAEKQKEQKVVYNVSDANACAVPTVVKDTRTELEKKEEEKMARMTEEFEGVPMNAEAKEVEFQVVGVLPPKPGYDGDFVDSLLKMMSGQIMESSFVPMDMLQKMENPENFETMFWKVQYEEEGYPILEDADSTVKTYFEYDTPEKARSALEKQYCGNLDGTSGIDGEIVEKMEDEKCKGYKSEFYLSSFGSRSADLLDMRDFFYRVVGVIGTVITVISVIIMMGVIGRVIGDSRRETAVFRAIGFKRFDIMTVYLSYGLVLAGIVATISLAMAMLGIHIMNLKFADALTAKAAWIYNVKNYDLRFSMMGWNLQSMVVIVGVILAVGLVGTLLPLLRSVRRNPINDMRDE